VDVGPQLCGAPAEAVAPRCTLQLFADPYKATIAKEDGSEVEEDIYESYNLTLVCLGVCAPADAPMRPFVCPVARPSLFCGQGVSLQLC
jgi:hypothetical protein